MGENKEYHPGSFTHPLEVQYVGEGQWRLLRGFTYWGRCVDIEGLQWMQLEDRCSLRVDVPASFITDFASIPSFAWSIIGHPAGPYVQAAVLHDWLYAMGTVSRKEADSIFLEAMGVLEVPWWRRTLMWMAVRTIGGVFYRGNK